MCASVGPSKGTGDNGGVTGLYCGSRDPICVEVKNPGSEHTSSLALPSIARTS